ncbi:sodium Bile symporter family protein [Candidatus Pelagibacter sp. HTCC7211]|uniref:bile acid:sodium symporter family protein n=1 Tax=Pelagibacter sp. (strain HTCC7211) TaxID=439493 RepID=UPI000183B033|nr:bile acid:sodium symporter family protein [Candidatus Pelagibacter sp. HTCC7211]EDZ60196.1 sodium Bile symporter family protein [Candidatus Pelagibacter sp. HTCC7211]
MEIVTKIAPIVLAIIMLGLGLGLSIKDFTRILRNPGDFFVGFISQLVILPIIALLVALILNLSAPLAVGLMIIAAAPGGVTSNVLTKFADGDVALSISLTSIVSLISIISVPLVVINSANFLGVEIAKDISMTGIALKMALVVTVPVILGMVIRGFAENFISSKISIINKLTGWLFIVVFAAIWIEEKNNIWTYLAEAGLAVLILNVTMMVLAYFIAKKFVSGIPQQKCIALECGLQNGTLAVFVATLIFDDIAYVIPTGAYALLMYITGFIFIYILRKSN